MDALRKQIGGSHYREKKIQPIEFIMANGLGFAEGCVIKYVTRHREKGGLEDLRKAKHYIEFLIEFAENDGAVADGDGKYAAPWAGASQGWAGPAAHPPPAPPKELPVSYSYEIGSGRDD